MFSEKIDDAINGYSIGLTFMAISLFFFWKNDYLLSKLATQIVATIVGLLGLVMCTMQLGKSCAIKGFDDFGIGAFLFLIWLGCYIKFNLLWLNLISIVFLLFGAYGLIRGCMEIGYSFFTQVLFTKTEKPKTTKFKEVFLLITQIFGFALTVLNILKIFGLIGTTTP